MKNAEPSWSSDTSKSTIVLPRYWMPYHDLPNDVDNEVKELEKLHPPPNLTDNERFRWGIDHYETIYEVLLKAQQEYGQRFHKGDPLFQIGLMYENKDRNEAIHHLLMAFIEDCITYSTREIWDTFSVMELDSLGISREFLTAVRGFVISKVQQVSLPQLMLSECLDAKGISESLAQTIEIERIDRTELNIQVARLTSALRRQIRPCFGNQPPGSEKDLAVAVNALCGIIDPSYEKEVTIGRVLQKEFVIDFLLFGRRVGLELKLVNTPSDLTKVKDQILTDLSAYVSVVTCIFLVYDSGGVIEDTTKLEDEIKLRSKWARLLIVKH